ncbi:hypothetical protein CsatA_015425 [Cannabis sativa]
MLSFTNTRPGHKWHDDLMSSSPSSGLSPAVYSGSNLNSDAFQEELAKILVCKLWFRRSPIATGCKYLQLRVSFIVGQLFHNQGDHILDNCVLLMGFIQLEGQPCYYLLYTPSESLIECLIRCINSFWLKNKSSNGMLLLI